MTRNEFLKLMGYSAVLAAAGCRTACACEKPRYALQLYSIHKIFWNDPVALLKKYPNRHHSIHAKENVPTVDGVLGVPPTDGGKCVPWDDVFAYMKTETAQKWWIVEAEGRPDSLEPAIKCVKFLRGRT